MEVSVKAAILVSIPLFSMFLVNVDILESQERENIRSIKTLKSQQVVERSTVGKVLGAKAERLWSLHRKVESAAEALKVRAVDTAPLEVEELTTGAKEILSRVYESAFTLNLVVKSLTNGNDAVQLISESAESTARAAREADRFAAKAKESAAAVRGRAATSEAESVDLLVLDIEKLEESAREMIAELSMITIVNNSQEEMVAKAFVAAFTAADAKATIKEANSGKAIEAARLAYIEARQMR